MSVQLRQIIEVPCDIDDLPRTDVLRRLPLDALEALRVDPDELTALDEEQPAPGSEHAGSGGKAAAGGSGGSAGSGDGTENGSGSDEADDADDADDVAPQPAREVNLDDAARERVDRAVAACLAAYEPRGAYKVFNPTICTLPPKYTEPAIKLVGTMMVFHGQKAYDKLRRATHCALMAATIGPTNPAALPEGADELDRQLADACARTLVECAADRVNADIVKTALEESLYTDDRLCPGEGDFPLDSRSQFVFYTQSQQRLGLKLDEDGELDPVYSTVGVVGMYDPSQKGRRRACGRCKYRSFCSIRAIGMTCHGRKGSFATK